MVINREKTELNPSLPLRIDIHELKRSDNDPGSFVYHDCLEIACVEEGTGVYTVNGRGGNMAPGDVIIFNNVEPHSFLVKERELKILVLKVSMELFDVSSEMLPERYLRPFIEKGGNFVNRIDGGNPNAATIRFLMQEIYKETSVEDEGYECLIKADILKIVAILLRYFRDEKNTVGGGKLLSQKMSSMENLKKTIDHLNSHFTEKISLDETAGSAQMAPAYFSNYFKKVTGISFSEYISVLRIGKARELKENTDMSMSEIAAECGFRNLSNFYRLYKKYTSGE